VLKSAKAAGAVWGEGGAGGVGVEVIESFHTLLCGCRFSRPVTVGDSGLYYVLCDKGGLTADKVKGQGRRGGGLGVSDAANLTQNCPWMLAMG
jgi:hypothetical protein